MSSNNIPSPSSHSTQTKYDHTHRSCAISLDVGVRMVFLRVGDVSGSAARRVLFTAGSSTSLMRLGGLPRASGPRRALSFALFAGPLLGHGWPVHQLVELR